MHLREWLGEGLARLYVSEHLHIGCYNEALADLMYTHKLGPPQLDLSAAVQASMLALTWNPVQGASEYWIYGASNFPWYSPGFGPDYEYRLSIVLPPTTSWSSSAGIGDPAANWTYLVMAVDEAETEFARSNRVGEEDYLSDVP